MDIESFLIERLAASREVTPAEVRESIVAAGEIDSMEGVELILAAEAKFGVDVPHDVLTSDLCRSLDQLVTLVRSKLTS